MTRTAFVLLLLASGCRSNARAPRGAAADASEPTLAVPVKLAQATRKNVPVIVSGPGRTQSIETEVVRAPFAGLLLDLVVSDGDHVKGGQVLGWMVSRDSEAELEGARAMLASAQTPAQRKAGKRALALAQRGLVKAALRAPERGIVLSHEANEEARLAANAPVVTVVAADAIVFVADIAQVDLGKVRPGQPATVSLAAETMPLPATVYAVLPGGSATDLTAPVRLDFPPDQRPFQLNLFGVAHITVDQHVDALVVPRAAVLRDDVTGTSRVAVVDRTAHAHWVRVHVGLTDGALVELVSSPIPAGTRVVVAGQVGLPPGAHVQVEP